jgi:hypothetical protein
MLEARATAELARLVFADVIGGLAATEEMEDVDALDLPLGSELEPTAAAAPTRRRRRKTVAAAPPAALPASEPPADAPAPGLPPLPDEPADALIAPADAPAVASPEDDPLHIGDEPVAEDAGGVEDAETTSSLTPVPLDAGDPPAENPDTPTAKQVKALNALVGQLREARFELEDGTKTLVLSNEQLWAALARWRNVDVDVMIDLLGGRDEAGALHWSPLRDSLTKQEASDLVSKLEDRAHKWGVK